MQVDPPKRRRVAPVINPPKRRRKPPCHAMQLEEQRDDTITVANFFRHVPEARPLAFGQKSHASCHPSPTDIPDPRMFPCMIVRDKLWEKTIPPTVQYRVDISLSWQDDIDFESKHWPMVYPCFVTEFGLRKHLGKALLSDVVYEKLKAYVEAHEEDWDPVNRSMYTVEDGRITDIEFTQAFGPFYLESLLYIEHHYVSKLRAL